MKGSIGYLSLVIKSHSRVFVPLFMDGTRDLRILMNLYYVVWFQHFIFQLLQTNFPMSVTPDNWVKVIVFTYHRLISHLLNLLNLCTQMYGALPLFFIKWITLFCFVY